MQVNYKEEFIKRRIALSKTLEAEILISNNITKVSHYEKELDRLDELINNSHSFIPYQLCPKCNGQKKVSIPPHIPGDVMQWSSSEIIFECGICDGKGIIPYHIPESEELTIKEKVA